MIYINEWFPNPVGNDASSEFVELYNSASGAVNLNGYVLADGSKKKVSLSGFSIAGDGYLALGKSQTKLTLKNASGGLLLYGPSGQLIDGAHFDGAAPEGKSYSRVDYSNAPIGHFAFLYPTPGAKNDSYDDSVAVNHYQMGVPLNVQAQPFMFPVLALSTALALLLLFIYVTHRNRNISDLFFGGNKEAGL